MGSGLPAGDIAEAAEGGDEVKIAGDEARPQTRNARPLGERLEYDDVGEAPGLGVGRLERSGRRHVAIDLRIAFVGEQEKVVRPRKRDRLGEIRARRNRPLRVRGRAEIEGNRALEQVFVDSIELGQEAGLRGAGEEVRCCARSCRGCRVGLVKGIGDDHEGRSIEGLRAIAGKTAENNPSREPLSGST